MLPDVRRSLSDFYAKRPEPAWYRKKSKQWRLLTSDLASFDASAGTHQVEEAGE